MFRSIIAILVSLMLLVSCQSTAETPVVEVESAPSAIDIYPQVLSAFQASSESLSEAVNTALATLQDYSAASPLIEVFLEDAIHSADSFEALEDFVLNVDFPASLYDEVYASLMAYADTDNDFTAILQRVATLDGIDSYIISMVQEGADAVATSAEAEAFFSANGALLSISPTAAATLGTQIYERLSSGVVEDLYAMTSAAEIEAYAAANSALATLDGENGGALIQLGTLLYELANGESLATVLRSAAALENIPLTSVPSLVGSALSSQADELVADTALLSDISGNADLYEAMYGWYVAQLAGEATSAATAADYTALAGKYSMLSAESLMEVLDGDLASLVEAALEGVDSIDGVNEVASQVAAFIELCPESLTASAINAKIEPLQLIASEANTYRLLAVFARNISQARWNSGFISRLETYLSTYGPETAAYNEEHYNLLLDAYNGYIESLVVTE